MATFKHISSKNADYGVAEQYLTFEHDEFTMKPTLDGNRQLVLRDDYRIASLNCGGEDFAIACMRSNLKYGKNQKREDVKSHHYACYVTPPPVPLPPSSVLIGHLGKAKMPANGRHLLKKTQKNRRRFALAKRPLFFQLDCSVNGGLDDGKILFRA